MSDVEERTETCVDVGRRAADRAESRMLIDGQSVTSASDTEFDNFSPPTGSLLGRTAAADVQDMDGAIAAARRAFDETDWSSNRRLRARCLDQLQVGVHRARRRTPGRDPRLSGGVCVHAGQACAATTRMLVHRSRYDEADAPFGGYKNSVSEDSALSRVSSSTWRRRRSGTAFPAKAAGPKAAERSAGGVEGHR